MLKVAYILKLKVLTRRSRLNDLIKERSQYRWHCLALNEDVAICHFSYR